MTFPDNPMAEPSRDYWSPEERQARALRRRERQSQAGAFAEALVQEGSIGGAARVVWPHLPPRKSYDKGWALTRTQAFQAALDKVVLRIKGETGLGPEWVVLRLKALATTAAKAGDRIRALEILGRHLGMFIERKEVRKLSVDLSGLNREELRALVAGYLEKGDAA